jgi:hypothetical protein
MRHTSLERANRSAKHQVFLEGDEIIVRMNHVKGVARKKWGPLFSEPHTITRIITDTCIEAVDEFGKITRLHIDRIKLYKRPPAENKELDHRLQASSEKISDEANESETAVVLHPACFTKTQRNQGFINPQPVSVPAAGRPRRAGRNQNQPAVPANPASNYRNIVRNNPNIRIEAPAAPLPLPARPQNRRAPAQGPPARNIINNTPAIARPPTADRTQPVSRTRAALQTAAALIGGTRRSARTRQPNQDAAYVYY